MVSFDAAVCVEHWMRWGCLPIIMIMMTTTMVVVMVVAWCAIQIHIAVTFSGRLSFAVRNVPLDCRYM